MAKIKSTPTKNLHKRKGNLGIKGKNKGLKSKKQPVRSPTGRKRFQRKKKEHSGVVYISHIPHGFYEEQIEAYFSQFGKVNAVSVPKSKSGRAKGYAFIEYKYPEIAKIAADTMNNYLMFNRLLKAKYIPPEEQKPHLFHLAQVAKEKKRTAADKAALAVKHYRKLKNRHLKIGLEAKSAKALLKKKTSLMKRAEKLGLDLDVTVQEANLKSIFERKKEIELLKKINSIQDLKPEKEEETDSSEEQMSSTESDNETVSLGSVDSFAEDNEEDFLSESEEEGYKVIISKAKNAAKDILRRAPKTKKLQKPIKGTDQALVPLDSPSSHCKKLIVGNENESSINILETSFDGKKGKKLNTSLKTKSRKKTDIVDNITIDKNNTSKETRDRKSLSNNIVIEKTPSSVKKDNTPFLTPTKEKLNISQVVMEVDSDDEISFKTPPNVVKKFIKTGKDSSKRIPKDKSITQSPLAQKKQDSHKKISKGFKSPDKVSSPTSMSGKKMRHRKLKHSVDSSVITKF